MLLSKDKDPNYHTPTTTNMLQLDNRQTSLLKRSGTLWRRLSKRNRPDPEAAQLELNRRLSVIQGQQRRESAETLGSVSEDDFKPQKQLHRRTTTESDIYIPAKGLIAHYQRIEVPAKMPVLKTTRPKSSRAKQPKPRPTVRVEPTAMLTTGFPVSPRVRTVAWNVFLTPDAVHSLWLGFSPEVMEDKWFVYSEGPDRSGKLKVHFHRSWTGLKIAELFVIMDLKGEGAGKIVGIKWNGSDQTNGMDEEEAKYMITMSCRWVMGVDLEKGM